MSSSEVGPHTAGRSAGRQFSETAVSLHAPGEMPNAFTRRYDFWDSRYEWRRIFSELFGTFLLVLVAAGGGMVNARFGDHAIPTSALVVAPALMVMAIILFMGAVSGARTASIGMM
jgi:aquaporin Z